jgi:hypothetical protein
MIKMIWANSHGDPNFIVRELKKLKMIMLKMDIKVRKNQFKKSFYLLD